MKPSKTKLPHEDPGWYAHWWRNSPILQVDANGRAKAKHAESLSGLIERVTYFKEDTCWAVLQVKVKGHRDLVAVVGSLASVSAGEWVTAEGRWVQDREFGLQFRAELLNSTAPTQNCRAL